MQLRITPGSALNFEVGRLRATPLGDWQQVVDLQQMGRSAATPGERIAITAASTVALPDVAPDSRGNVAPRRGLVAAVNRFAGRVRRCSGCGDARSAVREYAECRLRRRSDDRRDRHTSAGMEAIRRGAGHCSGCGDARSAVRGHAACRLRRRSGDRPDRHTCAGIDTIRRGAAHEPRRSSGGGCARWNAACAGAVCQCSGR